MFDPKNIGVQDGQRHQNRAISQLLFLKLPPPKLIISNTAIAAVTHQISRKANVLVFRKPLRCF